MNQPRTISPKALYELLGTTSGASVLDVRTKAEFEGVRVSLAQNMPLDQISVGGLIQNLSHPKESPLYLLCERGGRAAIAASHFQAAGYLNVFVVEGGTQAWVDANLPVIRGGRRSISIERQVRIGAGSLVLLGVIFGLGIHPAFFGLSAFVGTGLIFAGISDWCGMGLLLARAPWNR